MSRYEPVSPADLRQLAWLHAAPGEPMSGRVRYAAAMHFYQRGWLSEASLEVYRTCSVIDHEDPKPVLAQLGLAGELEAIDGAFRTTGEVRK